MMPELVMEIGSDFIKQEEKKKKNEQIVFIHCVKTFFDFVEMKRLLRKLDYKNVIDKSKEIMNGESVIKGTRIPTKAIYELFLIKCNEKNFNVDNFICDIKREYPSLKNKSESTILKGMLYYVAHKSIFNFLNR